MKRKFDRKTLLFFAAGIFLILVVELPYRIHINGRPILSEFWYTLVRQGGVMAMVALGLNLIYGFNGQFSLGQWGFYGIGAYAAADLTYRWSFQHTANGLTVLFFVVVLAGLAILGISKLVARIRGLDPLSAFALYLVAVLAGIFIGVKLGVITAGPMTSLLSLLPQNISNYIVFFFAILLAGGVAAEISYMYGLPVLTLGSDYFGIATLGFTMIVKVLLDNSDTILGFEEMKGARGMSPSTGWRCRCNCTGGDTILSSLIS